MKRLIRRLARVSDSPEYRQLRPAKVAGGRQRAPDGCVPVYVGDEMEWFAVRAEILGRPAFVELLRRSAAEYGYEQSGVLRIPCPVPLFRRLIEIEESVGAVGSALDELLRWMPGEIWD